MQYSFYCNKSAAEVARDFGIRVGLIQRWKREYLNDKNHSFPRTTHFIVARSNSIATTKQFSELTSLLCH